MKKEVSTKDEDNGMTRDRVSCDPVIMEYHVVPNVLSAWPWLAGLQHHGME
jgi:hypothetical protein